MPDTIAVTSHTARDLEQSAGLFKTDKAVIWEYVVNGLQYVDPGVSPVVRVNLDSKAKKIVIQDNGRGMDVADLHNFLSCTVKTLTESKVKLAAATLEQVSQQLLVLAIP